jgi:release factor glutamine methyltransferase
MDIKIEECFGVCPVGQDTRKLAQIGSFYQKRRALDMGTGTGYCAIFLAQRGLNVDATDIDKQALDCAKKNANLNKVKINMFFSNLFRNISDKYDLILFNPPANANENIAQRRFKSFLKNYLLKNSFLKSLASQVFFYLSGKKRVEFLNDFIENAYNYLNPEGILLMHLSIKDIPCLKKNFFSIKQIEKIHSHTAIFEIKFL